jgi:hypothetical protein
MIASTTITPSSYQRRKGLVEVVDLHLLFQNPQRDARIIGEMREKASLRWSTMVGENKVKNPTKPLGE